MSKRKLLQQRIELLQKQYEEMTLEEQRKVGSHVIALYQNGELHDHKLKFFVAKILGDEVAQNKSEQTVTNNVSMGE